MDTATPPQTKTIPEPIALEPPPSRGGFRLRHLVYIVLYCALTCWLGVVTGLVLISGFLGLAFATVCAGVYIVSSRRFAQQDALLWALAVTAEHAIPLAPTFEAFAGQCWGEYRRKVLAGAVYLKQGLSLPEVIAREPGLFPRDAAVLIRVGHDHGRLGAALREAAALRAGLRGPWMGVVIRLAYLLWVLIVFQAMAAFMSYFIIPKFEAIFNDFGVSLPGVTNLSIDAAHFFTRYFYLFLPLVAVEFGLMGLCTIAGLGLHPWDLPLVGPLFYRRHTALVLRCLAHVVDDNKPMARGVQTLASVYPVERVRQRLLRVAQDIAAGDDWCSALLARRLIRPPEASLLEAAKRLGNLSWALRQAADNNERRQAYRIQLYAQCILPVLVVAVGILVFLMAMAYFTPLIVLIEKLAP